METNNSDAIGTKSRVLLVEDHPIVAHGLVMLIDNQSDLCSCGSADSIAAAIPLVKSLKPDIVVVDISLGDGNGLDLIRQIHDEHPHMPMLALSMHEETVYAERALRAGARGYIMKREAMELVMTAIRRVLAGEIYVSPKMASHMVQKVISRPMSPMDALTDREFEVFRLLAQGIGPTEIGEKLHLSVKTIETHRGHIKEKLGVKTGAELTRFLNQWAMKHL